MSDGSGWTATSRFDPHRVDPLREHYGRPAFSLASPEAANYVGRVIVELWEGDGTDDVKTISVSLDPADRSRQQELIRRVAAALSATVG